jgi:hypothetical protein
MDRLSLLLLLLLPPPLLMVNSYLCQDLFSSKLSVFCVVCEQGEANLLLLVFLGRCKKERKNKKTDKVLLVDTE